MALVFLLEFIYLVVDLCIYRCDSSGAAWSAFACKICFRQSILQAIAEQSRIVRLPLNQVGSLNKINHEINKFEQENERKPSVEEMADRIDLPEEKIAEAMKINTHHVSMDAPFADGEDNSLLDFLPNTDSPSTDNVLDQ